MGFLSQKVEQSDLQAGDHIYSWRTPVYAYAHHGIYIGGNKVVHFTQVPNSSCTSFSSVPFEVETCLYLPDLSCRVHRGGVIMSCLNCFLGKKGSLQRYEYGVGRVALVTKFRGGTCTTAKSDLPEEVVHKAMHLLQNGFGKFDVLTNNCEHFAVYCKTGLYGTGSVGSGQVQSIYGVPACAVLSLPVRIFCAYPVVLGAAVVGNYALRRCATDLGVRSDAVTLKVEELAEFLRYWKETTDTEILGSVTEAVDLALVSSEEDAWKLESVAKVKVEDLAVSHCNSLSADVEGAGLFGSVTKTEDLAGLLSAEEDAWKIERVAEVKVEDLAALHHNILSADQEDAGLIISATKVHVQDLVASRQNLLSADQEGTGLFGSVTKAEDLTGLLSAEEDAWKIERVAEVKVEDLAALYRNILSADQEDAGLFRSATKVHVHNLAGSRHNLLSADQEGARLYGSVTKADDLAGLLASEEDAWQIERVPEIEVEDLAASHHSILSAEEDAGLLASIVPNRVERSELEAGDHIYTWRLPFTHAHHGIYKGEGKVIYSTQHKNPTSSSASKLTRFASLIPKAPTLCSDCEALGTRNHTNGVIISCLDCFLGEGSLHRFMYGVSKLDFVACSDAESDAPEVVIKRAMWLLEAGFEEYEDFCNNCEDFTSYCKTGFLCTK